MDDDAIRGFTVIKDGEITWPPPPLKLPAPPAAAKPAAAPVVKKEKSAFAKAVSALTMPVLALVLFALIGLYAPPAFIGHFTVFVLAIFVGYMTVWNVTTALHTPLMSVTNAISSIITIGALIQIAPPLVEGTVRPDELIRWIAIVGIGLTSINMFGGFAVTRRMLMMFHK